MKRLLIATALMLAATGVAHADDRWEEYREADRERYEAQREYAKERDEARREAAKDQREAEREYWKDRREAARDYEKDRREYDKDRREAVREYEKDRREYRKELAKSQREWARGQHLPRAYLDDRYFIEDYRAYDLAPPPRGYVWMRPDPRDEEVYLVQMATGVIAQILGH